MKKHKPLFTEISLEEAAAVNGGYLSVTFDMNIYYYIVGAAYVFGVPGVTNEELQFAWESAFVFDYRYTLFRRTRREDFSGY
ncbi:hypothetical protein [Nostoc sp. TCL26-01]|uniref:hypothetical protein n=1 Tax=Nostoc sp. TCL26-01 TaxID=2576904 RepID=UPI0015C0B461|nr:hypothetical protein [Nostoc sp. TCL26-01]QLE56011.1 hypothetical protein FD725_11025 [Nostoc sp. TCL26-01]